MVAGAALFALASLLGSSRAAQDAGAQEVPDTHLRAQQIIHRMIAAYGGMERWNSLRDASFVIRNLRYDLRPGRPVVSSTHIQFTKDPRPMIRLESHYQTTVIAKVYNGNDAWIASDGYELDRGNGARAQIRSRGKDMIFWVSFPFNLVNPSVRADYLGTTQLMGSAVDVLQVKFTDDSIAVRADDIYRFYVNRLTHLLLKEEHFIHGRTETSFEILYGDYRAVNGLVKDYIREVVNTATGAKKQRAEIEDLRFGSHLSRELFEKPPHPLTADTSVE